MRILALVTDAFGGHGGIAKFNRDLLTALCGAPEVEQVVAIPRLMPDPPGELPNKLRFVTSGLKGKLSYVAAVLKAAIANRRSSIILCGHINLLPAAFAARLFCRAPVALVVYGIDAWQPTRSKRTNRLAGKVDAFISISEFTRDRFLGWTPLNGVNSFILPCSVELSQLVPGPKDVGLVQRYSLEGRTVLLTLARLSAEERYKGIDEVMEILPEIAREVPNLTYLIVGDGSDRERLEQKSIQLGVCDRVVFAGRISDEEKAAHYRLADAFVMPGWGEGFGIVYLESLACGVPVVASKLDGSREAVRNGELGVLVDARNRAELRAGILKALNAPKGIVPEGLRYFSRQNFDQRCREILERLPRG